VADVFDADTNAIAGLGTVLDRAGIAGYAYALYTDGCTQHESHEGLLGAISSPIDDWQEIGAKNTRRGAELAEACGKEPLQAATWYSNLEKTSVARLRDRTYPEALPRILGPNEVVGSESAGKWDHDPVPAGKDPRNPAQPYHGPGEPTESAVAGEHWPLGMEERCGAITEKASVTRHLRDLLNAVIGRDLINEVLALVSGNWRKLYEQAMIFADTGTGFDAIKKNVDLGRYAIQTEWRGNAGWAASNWLEEYCTACAEHSQFMLDGSKTIAAFARGAYHQLAALDAGLDTILDLLVDLATCGAGGAIGIGISVLRGENPMEIAKAIVVEATKVGTVIDVLWVAAHRVRADLERLTIARATTPIGWPCTPYDHPEPGI
jgi:hypothetical protein